MLATDSEEHIASLPDAFEEPVTVALWDSASVTFAIMHHSAWGNRDTALRRRRMVIT